MKHKVLQNLDKIDDQLQDLFDRLGSYPNEVLNKKPSEDDWSAMDNLHHLMRSERLSYGYIRKKLSFNPKLKKANLSTAWRSWLLSTYLRFPMKFKAPEAVAEEHFPEYSTLQEVSEQWKQQRLQLKSYLEDLPEHVFDKELYKHPFAGRVTIRGMVDFFGGHLERHSRQIDRALDKLKASS
jgi:hypothetical protein